MKRKYLQLMALCGFLVTFDQLTKLLVVSSFRLGEALEIIPGFFELTYIRNTGAAFGILASLPENIRVPFFILIPIVALLAIGFYFYRVPDTQQPSIIGFSLIIGGAFGNLIDRIRLNYVVDFLYFHIGRHYFPAFNVADSAITVGVFVVVFLIMRDEWTQRKKAKMLDQQPSSPSGS